MPFTRGARSKQPLADCGEQSPFPFAAAKLRFCAAFVSGTMRAYRFFPHPVVGTRFVYHRFVFIACNDKKGAYFQRLIHRRPDIGKSAASGLNRGRGTVCGKRRQGILEVTGNDRHPFKEERFDDVVFEQQLGVCIAKPLQDASLSEICSSARSLHAESIRKRVGQTLAGQRRECHNKRAASSWGELDLAR